MLEFKKKIVKKKILVRIKKKVKVNVEVEKKS